MSCSVCEKHKSIEAFKLFEEQGLVISHWPTSPQSPEVYLGYFFIETREHLTSILDLNDEQSRLIGLWLKALTQIHRDLLGVEKTYFFKFADITPHFHIHVYPRHLDTPADILGEAVRHWKDAPKANDETLKAFIEKARSYFVRSRMAFSEGRSTK